VAGVQFLLWVGGTLKLPVASFKASGTVRRRTIREEAEREAGTLEDSGRFSAAHGISRRRLPWGLAPFVRGYLAFHGAKWSEAPPFLSVL